jgi:Ca2+-binding RTX toxin-like protein
MRQGNMMNITGASLCETLAAETGEVGGRLPGDGAAGRSFTHRHHTGSPHLPAGASILPHPAVATLPAATTGDDRFIATAAVETFDGGAGSDWVSYAHSTAGIRVGLMTGTARGGFAEGDRLTAIENLEGTAFGDAITGSAAHNTLTGFQGNDAIHGNGGNDTIRGNIGNDFLTGGDGRDRINGGPGDDLIDAGAGEDIVYGGAGNDVIYGGPDPDVICFNFKASEIAFRYDGSDYSIWVEAPDGTDHIYSALTIATTTGTYRFDVPSQSWIHDPAMTTGDWMNM